MKIEQVKTEKLIPYARNAKRHDESQIASIAGSIKEFGFNNPVLIDKDNCIIAGHGRVLAAQKLKLESVPCIRLGHLNENQKRAYIIADNRLAETGGGWDEEMLKLEIADIDFSEFENFELGDLGNIGDIVNFSDESKINKIIDVVPEFSQADELAKKWGVKEGQLWEIGRHLLLCGDSNNESNVAKLLGKNKKETIIFDPEWDKMPEAIRGSDILAFCDGGSMNLIVDRYGAPTWIFAWDCITSWYTPNRPLRRMKLCAWYGDINNYKSDGAFYGDPGKEHMVSNTRGTYNYIPDARGKHLSDIFPLQITKLHSEENHPHSKPLEWITCLIGNCTNGHVFDPFIGSGTSMVACEMLNRTCFGIEISPKFCALTLERMKNKFPNIKITKKNI